MMNLKKVIIAIVIYLFVFITNVYAEEITLDNLPKEYTSGEFKYTIDGFELKIYDASNDAEGNNKYLSDKKVLYTVPITDQTLSINLEEITSSLNKTPGTFIDLNLNIDKTNIEKLVKSKIPTINNNEAYIFELIVNYKFSSLPDGYQYTRHVNVLDAMLSLFTGTFKGFENVTLNTSTYQIINMGVWQKDNNVETFVFDEKIDENEKDSTANASLLDYVHLSQTDDIIISSETDNSNNYIFMFHNIDNIEELLSSYNDTTKQIDDMLNEKEEEKEVVKVGNTAKTLPIIGFVIGLIILLLGTFIIIKEILPQKEKI